MISLVRSWDISGVTEPLNPLEERNWVKIVSLSNRIWSSNDPRSIISQVRWKFSVNYNSLDWCFPENIGGVFSTPDFVFRDEIKGRAFAIVWHDGGDMQDGDYSRAETGLTNWLERIYREVIRWNQSVSIEALRWLDEYFASLVDWWVDLSRLDEIIDTVRSTKARLNPLLRIPLFARESPEDCERLLGVMNNSPTNLVLYIGDNTRELVKATLLKFPRLYRTIPALADESLELAA